MYKKWDFSQLYSNVNDMIGFFQAERSCQLEPTAKPWENESLNRNLMQNTGLYTRILYTLYLNTSLYMCIVKLIQYIAWEYDLIQCLHR